MDKLNVMFMQSQSYFGSDSMIHSLMMRHFNRERVNVHVACNKGSPNEESASLRALKDISGLHVRPTHFGTSVNFRSKQQILLDTVTGAAPAIGSLAGLVRYARHHNIQIIHGTEKPRDAFYGVLLARAIGAKSVVHLHVKVDHSWMSPLTQWAMKRADGLIAVSAFVADSAVKAGYAPEKVFYALNSLDTARWNPDTDGSSIRREFGIAPEAPVLAIISRLFPWKGHTQLLHALAKVKTQRPDIRLLLVGEDDPRATPGRGSYTAELKALSQELNLHDQVIFTGFRRDIVNLLAASDIYTMPTYEEPCAVAFLEAMAMRKPIIALASGGTPQLVDHGEGGLLSEPYDVDQLAANIVTLVEDPARRAAMGAYSLQRVNDYFTPTRMADEVEQIYRRILGSTEPRGAVLTNTLPRHG